MPPLPLSVVLITYEAADLLPACLATLDFADEILVVDSNSQDATLDIARAGGARVLTQAWLGYGAQKQFAVQQAKHAWVLCLDADERVSDTLRTHLLQEMVAPYFLPMRCRAATVLWVAGYTMAKDIPIPVYAFFIATMPNGAKIPSMNE